MKNQVNFGHLIAVIIGIIVPVIIWGANVERRFEKVYQNSEEINVLKADYRDSSKIIQQNHLEVMNGLHNIELQLKDKQDKE